MSDFNSWDEIREYLLEEGEYNQVSACSWFWTKGSMMCWATAEGEPCCDDQFNTIEECIESIMRLSDGVESVEKV